MTQQAPGTRPADVPAPGSYLLDPERTVVRADVRAMFGLATVHGTFRLNGGQLVVAADPTRSSVRASIDAGSFASGLPVRDGHVRSARLLDAGAYPEITFAGDDVRPDGDGWILAGSVTVHGISQPVEIRVTGARLEDGTARFRATARLDRTAFGITRMKGRVGRIADLTIEAVALIGR
jgi:polyisoprenoid-binding protein YceI